MSDARTQPKNIVPDDYVPNLDERVISGDALPDAKSLSDPAALAQHSTAQSPGSSTGRCESRTRIYHN
jgi:hypothetical protein